MRHLPPDWQLVPLDDLKADEPGAITDGPFGSKLTSAHYSTEGARVVRLQNIGDGVFKEADAFIPWDYYQSLRKHEVRAGDLLVASLGDDPPRACLAPANLGPAIVKADCIRVRLAADIDARWVMYAMQTSGVRTWAARQMHGVGRLRLGLKTIRAIPIPRPPLKEQRHIVELVDDHVSRLDAGASLLSTAEQRTRSFVRAVLEAVVPDVPEPEWKESTVGQAGRLQLGRARHPDWHDGPEIRPYLRVANVFEDRIDTASVMSMDFSGVFEKYRLVDGDVLLNEGQSPHLLGRPAIYRGVPDDVAFTNSLIRFQAGADVLPEWALLVFRRHMHSGRFRRESRITTNIAHLSMARLRHVEFPIPPLDEQRARVRKARELLAAVDYMEHESQRARAKSVGLRRALLDAAFGGWLTGRKGDFDRIEELAAASS